MSVTLRLGTRGSHLALAQSTMIAGELEQRHPGLQVQLVRFKTSGDQIVDRPLHEAGGKGLFTRELEQALLDGSVDFAVHSFKDVPVTMPLVDTSRLCTAAVPLREDPRDLLVTHGPRSIHDLPHGAKVGTGSLRRRSQLLAIRSDLDVQLIRGNIDTRLRRLREGRYDAIVLALAGVRRGGLFDASTMFPIELSQMLPAAAQGALCLQCRADDTQTRALLAALDDPHSHACVDAERAVVAGLSGDCHSPIAALATIESGQMFLKTAVGRADGGLPVLRAEASAADAKSAVDAVLESLNRQGVRELLHGA